MEQYAIKGGNPLVGEVEIGGAKNAALPILAASVMTDETVYIENMPDVRDTNVLLCAMENIGVIVKRTDRHKVTLNASNISELVVEDENIKKIRASYYLIGALLGKYKHAEVALPGGCDIGCRAIDQHIKGFRALGAEVKIEHGLIKTHAEHLRGSHIYMDVVSVGATINIMMAAVMAEGTTIIENSAKEPHVAEELKAFREKTSLDKYLLQSYLSDELEAHRAAKQARRKRRREAMETAFRRRVEGKLDILSTIAQSLEKARAALDDGIDPDEEALARHRQELEDLIAAVHRKEEQVRTRSIRRYEAALRVLRGNPTAKAREELGEAFESLRKLLER